MASDVITYIKSGVQHDGKDGELTLFIDRIVWKTFEVQEEVTLAYENIKSIKITPEVRDKLFLRLFQIDGTKTTFKFQSKDFKVDCQNRDHVKSLIAKLMMATRDSQSSNSRLGIVEKNKMLKGDVKLYDLYKEIVVGGFVTPDEFWSSPIILRNKIPIGISRTVSSKAPIPNSFWSTLVPISTGCNEINLKLLPEAIDTIFLTYPAVKQRFQEMVPDKISDTDFWTEFFQALLFYRDRTQSKRDNGNSFYQIFLDADNNLKNSDMTNADSKDFDIFVQPNLPEGYGEVNEAGDENEFSFGRRFNLQSHSVLKTFQETTINVINNPYTSHSRIDENHSDLLDSLKLDTAKFSVSDSLLKEAGYKPHSNSKQMIIWLKHWQKENYQISVPTNEEPTQTDTSASVEILDVEKSDKLVFHCKILYELVRILWSSLNSAQSNLPKISSIDQEGLNKKMQSIEIYYKTKYLPWLAENSLKEFEHVENILSQTRHKFQVLISKIKK